MTSDADIFIAPYIASNKVAEDFAPLSQLQKDSDFISEIYPSILTAGIVDQKLYLLPIAFDLPLVEFIPEHLEEELPIFWISLQELEDVGVKNKVYRRNKLSRLGFSLVKDPRFLYEYIRMNGARFQAEDAYLQWDDANLISAIHALRNWNQSNKDEEREDFEATYLSIPLNMAMEQDRLAFAYNTISSLSVSPQQERWNTDFIWLSHAQKIHVIEDVIYAGINIESRKKQQAEDFLRWLLSSDTQEQFIAENSQLQLPIFGIAGKLSSLIAINETVLPQYHTHLRGRIPASSLLETSSGLPANWATFKAEYLLPWIVETLQSPTYREDSLTETVENWYLHSNQK